MRRLSTLCLLGLLTLAPALPARAWPAEAYPDIFAHAALTLPGPMARMLADMETILSRPCGTTSVEDAAARAITELSSLDGNLQVAAVALRDAACAAAALNDPADAGIDDLVRTQKDRFAIVFYGWHPAIRDGNLPGYVQVRQDAHARLRERFGRSTELPNLSEAVEVSPEFGMASIAFSHAVTDVANVWLYIWDAANGAR